MKSYLETVLQDVRLSLLTLLDSMPDGSLTVGQLDRALDARPGDGLSRDELETQIGWLESARLITVERIAGVGLVRLTVRGADAARGKVRVPGVTLPRDAGL
ncbi:MAG: VpaChn25_0724 family phage protein [Panacagrimonas sp.]